MQLVNRQKTKFLFLELSAVSAFISVLFCRQQCRQGFCFANFAYEITPNPFVALMNEYCLVVAVASSEVTFNLVEAANVAMMAAGKWRCVSA